MSQSLQRIARNPETVVLEEQSLARAFASFTEAAASLERSYSQLQAEVARLRHELEATNCDLARSLEENHRIRERLDQILRSLPCGVLVTEADGRVSVANPETERLLGMAGNATLPGWMSQLLERTAGSSELEYHCDNGEVEWMVIRRARPGAMEGGGSVFILQSISGLKRLQREHELLRRRQALAEMSALLAHEIRNPLASMELFAGLLSESVAGEEQQQWVKHLQAGLRTLAATVNNVLHFHSPPQPELAPTDLGQLLHSLRQFLAPLAQQARVRVDLVHRLHGVQVAADRHRLEQVLFNLALNAFRFMPGGGLVKICGGVHFVGKRARARVELADTGPGIAPENLARIFQPGFTTRPGSPGLGLAVCRTIVEQHGGSIAVRSRPGRGATFLLEFPVAGVSQ